MSASEIAADALVVLGIVVITIGVVGLFRMPDVYTQLHAASKAVFLGVIALLAATIVDGGGSSVTKAILVAVFLLLTTPISSHVIAQAAYATGEASHADTVDESGREDGPDAT